MTILKNNGKQWEWTLLLDTFNNEIIAHSVSPIAGDNKPYYHCLDKLNSLAGKKEEQKPQVVFHTDQGAVYSSRAFCHAHEHYNILRSMSRGGTPTDNPIIEALNGWIKEELYLDYGLADADNLPELLNQYVYFFNHLRPAAALGYKSPVQYKTELDFLCHSSTDSSAASSVGAAQRINNIKVNKIRFVNNNRFWTTYGAVSLCGVDGNYVTKLFWTAAGMGKNRSRNRMTKCPTVSGFPEVTVFAPFILQELSDIVQQCSCNSKVNIHLILFVRSIGSVERLSCLCTYLRYTVHMIGIGENEFRKIECKWDLAQFLHFPVPLLQCSNVGVNHILL